MENRLKRGQGGSEMTIWEATTVNPEDDSEISGGGDQGLDSGCILKTAHKLWAWEKEESGWL